VATSSSTKKAAKLAQKGKGRKVRFQGGTVFPAAVAVTLVVGLALIVYSRATLPAADDSPPTINDHWHAAYGIYLCDDWYTLGGNLEELNAQGQLVNTDFLRTGIHSHDDGVIHWHPYTSAAVGDNAVLGIFLENYGVEVTNDSITFANPGAVVAPEGYPLENGFDVQDEYVEGETQCNGEEVDITVVAWDSYADTGPGTTFITDLPDVRLTNDGMVFVIAIVPPGTEVSMPPWAIDLPELGAIDGGNVPTPSTQPGDTTEPATTTGG
jgi:hypothetical protein